MANAAEGLGADSEYLSQKCTHTPYRAVWFLLIRADADIEKYKTQVDTLDERVGDLEAVVRELEEWTGELGLCPPSPPSPLPVMCWCWVDEA